jgi:hypothetical protein
MRLPMPRDPLPDRDPIRAGRARAVGACVGVLVVTGFFSYATGDYVLIRMAGLGVVALAGLCWIADNWRADHDG